MKFLVIQTAFIGDVILATSVLEKLHVHYPDAQIDFLVQKGNASLVRGHPFLHAVLVFDKKQGKLQSMWKIINRVRQERYDVVINLHRFLSSGLMTALSGAKKTFGFDKNPMSRSFTSRIKHEISVRGTLHEAQRNLLLISSLTDGDLSTRPRLYPSSDAYLKVKQDEEYVCIAPASVWFTKQWPVPKWIELIDRLADRYLIFLLGSKQDKELCMQIKDAVKASRVQILAGELTLLESAALMQRARMNYVNDSAPLHLASAMNAPVTSVFCSTVPAFGFGPLSDKSFVIETSHVLDCRPCGLHGYRACPMGHFKCADIGVSLLIEKIELS
ncbi:MAG TPA: glycosyltransferase family 9 protein [Saprospiraceae bacterium]|nr:glycosyltransferase family 9 protein [Saprospiraceae bacterium]